MGSPNFYTGCEGLNVAFDTNFIEGYDYEDPDDNDDYDFFLNRCYDAMKEFVDGLSTQFFHTVEIDYGYHNGFQVYISEEWKDLDAYMKGIVDDWEKYKCFTDAKGYEYKLEECPYFKSNAKNITYFSLQRAIEKEYKTLHNLLLEKAKELDMGQVVGSSWTSSVKYPINAKKI